MNLRRRAIMGIKKSRLPKEYQEVEYLQSTLDSNVWINTNYIPKIAPKIITTISALYQVDKDAFGFGNSIAPLFIVDPGIPTRLWYNRWGATAASTFQLNGAIEKSNWVFGKETSKNGDILKVFADTDWSSNTQSLNLFRGRNVGINLTIYNDFYFYDGDLLARKLIPCYRKSDSKPGMYDLTGSICPLTGTPFYINANTSATTDFIVGADVN